MTIFICIFGTTIILGLIKVIQPLKLLISFNPQIEVKYYERGSVRLTESFIYTPLESANNLRWDNEERLVLSSDKHKQNVIEQSVRKLTRQMISRGLVRVTDKEADLPNPVMRKVTMTVKITNPQ